MHQEKKMLAHISEDGTRVQTVADHLQGTAVLCGQFAAAFDAQQQGTWLGLLHDIGKYSTKFQKRLQGGEKVDHSTAGAQVAARYGQIPLAFAIAGHHSGLPDGGGRSDTAQDATMFGRLKKSVEPYTQWTKEIKLPSIPPQPEMMKENRFTQAFYSKNRKRRSKVALRKESVDRNFSRVISLPFSCMSQFGCSSVMPVILFFTSSRFMVETPFCG